MLKHDLERSLSVKIPTKILTDSESLFRIIVKPTTSTKKRLMIYMLAAREVCESGEISNIGWIKFAQNAADVLTKENKCNTLEQILDTESLRTSVEQWSERAAKLKTKYATPLLAERVSQV